MYGILLSALNTVLGTAIGLFFRTVVIKFVFFSVMFLIATELLSVIQNAGLFPTAAQIQSGLSAIPPSVGYFCNVFNLYWGMGVVISAWSTRFIIRRLPKFNG